MTFMKRNEISIVILHGWGLSGSKYEPLTKILEQNGYRVYAPDFPGFGDSKLIDIDMHLADFSEYLDLYLKRMNIKKCILIGHSFGGRVGIYFASQKQDIVKMLVLTGVPVIRHYGQKQRLSFLAAKTFGLSLKVLPHSAEILLKKIFYKIIGERDYINSGEKKKIFQNIINEPLIPYLKKIKIPITLIWGAEDSLTPASDVVKISSLGNIKDSKVAPGVGHGFPYKESKIFANILEIQIKKYA